MYTLLYIIYNFILFSRLNVIAWYNIIPYYNILIYKKFELTFDGWVLYNFILYSIILYYCTPILFLSPIHSKIYILTRIGVTWRAYVTNKNIGNVNTFIIPVNFVFSTE